MGSAVSERPKRRKTTVCKEFERIYLQLVALTRSADFREIRGGSQHTLFLSRRESKEKHEEGVVFVCRKAVRSDQRNLDIESQGEPSSLQTNFTRKYNLSLCVRKPTICMGENKDADQLRGNREADQRLCFRYTDSTRIVHFLLYLYPNFQDSGFLL